MSALFAAFTAALACILFTRGFGTVAGIWLADGIVAAMLMRQPRARWWPVALAGAAGIALANLAVGRPPMSCIGFGLSNLLDIVTTAALTSRWVGGRVDLSEPRQLPAFVVAGGLVGPGMSGLAGALVLHFRGGETFHVAALQWYASVALGMLMTVPALLAIWDVGLGRLREQIRSGRAMLPGLFLVGVLALVFGQSAYPLSFLVLPALICCALRLDTSAVGLALLLTGAVSAVATLNGLGPTASLDASLAVRLAISQALLATMTLVAMPLCALQGQRRRLDDFRRAALDASELAEQRLRLAGQIAGLGYWRIRAGDREVLWSDETFAMHGLPVEGVRNVTERAFSLYSPAAQERFRAGVKEMFASGATRELTVEVQRPDNGELRILRFKGEAQRSGDGAVVALFGVVRDVTDEETFLQQIEASEARYRLLADSSTDVVMKADAAMTVQYVSPAVRRYGYDPAELVGVLLLDLVHPDDVARVADVTAELFREGVAGPGSGQPFRVRVADGAYVWAEGRPSLVLDDEGRPAGFITPLRDVSERIAAQRELEQSEARYRLIAEHLTDVVSRASLAGEVLYMSPSVTPLLGYEVAEVTGRKMIELVHPEDAPGVEQAYVDLVTGQTSDGFGLTYRMRHKDGRWLWLESRPTAVRDAAGRVAGFVDLTRDVTARVTLEEELRQARDAAEAAAAVKAEFMANMSHEIRTPLTAILGFTSLLSARDDVSGELSYQVDRIAGAGQALLAIVNDILDFSKLEAGQMPITPRAISPRETLADALALFEPQAAGKRIAMDFHCAGEMPGYLSLDPDRVRQILLNLVGNAVKFTERGRVTLDGRYDPERQRLVITVRDTGPGMDAEQQAKLFQRFSQVDASRNRRHGGTGLGLAICSGLAEAMGGTIAVKSTLGEGSEFVLELPAPPCAPPDVAGPAQPDLDLGALQVLVVDDNSLNRELARAVLEPLGAEVSEAADGFAAIEMAQFGTFDVILMDVRMPGMDGPETTLRIRSQPGPNQRTPILAFSADYDLERFGEQGGVGFNGFVRKPLELAALLEAIEAVVGGGRVELAEAG